MRVILADINGFPQYNQSEAASLREFCHTMGIVEPKRVYNFEQLETTLGEEVYREFLLFSNFPPDSTFPETKKPAKIIEIRGVKIESAYSDSYSMSRSVFRTISSRFRFRAVHFITGAPSAMLPDGTLIALFPNTKVSVARKNSWIHSELDFHQLYSLFIIEKIKEAVLHL